MAAPSTQSLQKKFGDPSVATYTVYMAKRRASTSERQNDRLNQQHVERVTKSLEKKHPGMRIELQHGGNGMIAYATPKKKPHLKIDKKAMKRSDRLSMAGLAMTAGSGAVAIGARKTRSKHAAYAAGGLFAGSVALHTGASFANRKNTKARKANDKKYPTKVVAHPAYRKGSW